MANLPQNLEKRKLFDSYWVIRCKECGNILASASSEEQLPKICECDCAIIRADDS